MRRVLPPIAALTICAFSVCATAAPGDSPTAPGMDGMQQWAADHAALLDARLAGLKAGLKLTPDQEKLWPPFETAIRDSAKLRMEQMAAMMDRAQKMRDMMQRMDESRSMADMGQAGQSVSLFDRLEAMGQRMSDRGAALKKVAAAVKPLYASLDDSQKRLFSFLGGELLIMRHGHHGMGMMGGMGTRMMRDRGEMMSEPGQYMMGRENYNDGDGSDEE